MDTYIDNEIDNLREGLRLGYSAPRVTVEAVPSQVRSLIGPDSIFLGSCATHRMTPPSPRPWSRSITRKSRRHSSRFADFIENEYLQ